MVDLLIEGLIVSFALNMAMFLVAYRLQSDKLTDVSYAATFAILAAVGFVNGPQNSSQIILLCMILLWALRIGGFLLFRVIKVGKDNRFNGVRDNFRKFASFWLSRALTVWVLMIPASFVFRTHGNAVWLAILGSVIWLIGFVIETTADFQKFAFSQDRNNNDKWIESGIWHYSRHPNYFGEILVWTGVYLFCLQSLTVTQSIIGLVSPLFIAVLLLFVSGIPPLEKMADERWGHLEKYKSYKNHTSILVPLPKLRDKS